VNGKPGETADGSGQSQQRRVSSREFVADAHEKRSGPSGAGNRRGEWLFGPVSLVPGSPNAMLYKNTPWVLFWRRRFV